MQVNFSHSSVSLVTKGSLGCDPVYSQKTKEVAEKKFDQPKSIPQEIDVKNAGPIPSQILSLEEVKSKKTLLMSALIWLMAICLSVSALAPSI